MWFENNILIYLTIVVISFFWNSCQKLFSNRRLNTLPGPKMLQLIGTTYHLLKTPDDAGTIKWTLTFSPLSMIFISLIYLYVVYFAGPQFMKNREPYSLKKFMQCYNFFQIIANFWIAFNAMIGGSFATVWRYCEPIDKIYGSNTEKQLELIWWALLHRIIDFIETVVFVLRKKDRQISVLHTYHHLSTVIWLWLVLRYLTHGHAMYAMTLNGFVHVIMYCYYFLSTFGSNVQRRLSPFKKWITIIQMVQIALIWLATSPGLMPNCGNQIVKYYSFITVFNGIINSSLFINFYGIYKKSKTT